MLYELRIYDAVAGRLPDISGRFANHTCALFRKHGVKYLGFWTDEIGRSNRLTYINVFDSMADRESRWAKFGSDPDWLEVRKQTEANGPLVDAVTNRFLRPTPYSPEPKISTAVQELRIYEAMPGRLPTCTTGLPTTPSACSKSTVSRTSATGPRTLASTTSWSTCWATPASATGRRVGGPSRPTPSGTRRAPPARSTDPSFASRGTPSCARLTTHSPAISLGRLAVDMQGAGIAGALFCCPRHTAK